MLFLGESVFVPPAVRDYDPRSWNLEDVLVRFRPDRFATAYSDPVGCNYWVHRPNLQVRDSSVMQA